MTYRVHKYRMKKRRGPGNKTRMDTEPVAEFDCIADARAFIAQLPRSQWDSLFIEYPPEARELEYV